MYNVKGYLNPRWCLVKIDLRSKSCTLEKISNIQVGLNLDFTRFLDGFLPKLKLGKNAIYPILVYKLDFVLTKTGK